MKLVGSMPHSQGPSNKSNPESNQFNWSLVCFNASGLLLYIPMPSKRFLSSRFKVSNALLPSSILTTCPAYHNVLDLMILATLGNWRK